MTGHSPYPDDFWDWPAERRNEWFAAAAREYDERKAQEIEPTKPNGQTREAESAEEREIARLARLDLIEYERMRAKAAEGLGLRTSILDKVVANARSAESVTGSGRKLELPPPEPWPEAVNGSAVIDELTKGDSQICRPVCRCGSCRCLVDAPCALLRFFLLHPSIGYNRAGKALRKDNIT